MSASKFKTVIRPFRRADIRIPLDRHGQLDETDSSRPNTCDPASRLRRTRIFSLAITMLIVSLNCVTPIRNSSAQDAGDEPGLLDPEETPIETPEKVEVEPVAVDEDISVRLSNIFNATNWFEQVEVSTDEGVVFLNGIADTEQHRQWAERVAQRTSDVVAVVNQIEVAQHSVWDVGPAIAQLRTLGRDFVQLIPLLIIGAFVILVSYLLAKLSASLARRVTGRRVDSQLLQQVIASVVAVLVMLIGIYIALKVSGLSRLAVTVLGGTGLVGLALGFAFRDIAENYLSSILISLNRPFNVGDLIELEGNKGFVRRVTTRGTLLLTVDGNHIQIPNSTVYKAIVKNYSSSPRIRREFTVGIGYDDSVTNAQEQIYGVLTRHEAVLDDPAPMVLVDSLGASTVNLVTRFWLDSHKFDAGSVLSAVMRQAKTALSEANISMPDESREVVFPQGVPVAMLDASKDRKPIGPPKNDSAAEKKLAIESDKTNSSTAEGGLANKDEEIQSHAADGELEQGENLIE
ncbi:mechanosensitive ion channel domain-containing protein [Aporhodopirellula aestuarii]|uniref:Mechanosensitive ion channel n=1 Tax=Aporhodopirellula aestuarii TaxID=2950107 RepID=A0ABT0TZG3_9BACT|nr:mechanosensitive ion channel domain-containing protein [Aporhodopirellula aestuarii]MCM2369774.1 mechanosensitive ion channel [Aporhodopirellula aestuarii]